MSKGKRQDRRSLELLAGAGGSLLGYKCNGFDTAMAAENDKDAVHTLEKNNESCSEGCIRKSIQGYDTLKCALGKIDQGKGIQTSLQFNDYFA